MVDLPVSQSLITPAQAAIIALAIHNYQKLLEEERKCVHRFQCWNVKHIDVRSMVTCYGHPMEPYARFAKNTHQVKVTRKCRHDEYSMQVKWFGIGEWVKVSARYTKKETFFKHEGKMYRVWNVDGMRVNLNTHSSYTCMVEQQESQ